MSRGFSQNESSLEQQVRVKYDTQTFCRVIYIFIIFQQFADLGLNKSSDRRQSQDNKSSRGNSELVGVKMC